MSAGDHLGTVLGLLERLGVEVRGAHLGGSGGGLCVLRGRRIMVLDLDADEATRTDQCARALASLPEADGIFIPPAIRELMDVGGS